MVLKPPGGLASAEVPQSESLVPGAGQGKMTIRGQNYVGDEVAVM